MTWRWWCVFQALSWSVAGLLVDGFSWYCCIFLVCFCWNSEQVVLVSSFSKGTCKEAVAAVYVNLIASVTWFHLFLEEKEIQGRVMWFSASISSDCTEPHNQLKGNRNKDMAHFEIQGLSLFISLFLSWLKSVCSHMHVGVCQMGKNQTQICNVGFCPSRKEFLLGCYSFIGLKCSGNRAKFKNINYHHLKCQMQQLRANSGWQLWCVILINQKNKFKTYDLSNVIQIMC